MTAFPADVASAFARVPRGVGIITNAPYDSRPETHAALGRFGAKLRERADIQTAFVLSAVRAPAFERTTGLPWREVVATQNGGIPVWLLQLSRA